MCRVENSTLGTRQTASRAVDSSRLSGNKYDTRGVAITLFVLGGAFSRLIDTL